MKLKKTAKILIPSLAATSLIVALPLALTSCSSSDKFDASKDIQWAVPQQTTYFYSKANPQMPILNGNFTFTNKKFDSATVTYQWYKNSLPMQNASSSQLVIEKGGQGNYYCQARINYNGNQYVAQSPIYIVEQSPITLTVQTTPNPTNNFLSNFIGQLDGYCGTLSATLTSTDASINLKELDKEGNIQYSWIQKGIFGDKVVSTSPTFTPTSLGVYYCKVQIIYNGQYLISSSPYKVILPNAIDSTISSNINNHGSGDNYYLGTKEGTQSFTMTPKATKYMGKDLSTVNNLALASMWVKKIDTTGNNPNNPLTYDVTSTTVGSNPSTPSAPSNPTNTVDNGKYEVISPMRLGEQSLNIKTPGEYVLIEAMYPQGVESYQDYGQIKNFKYTKVDVSMDQEITIPGIDNNTSTQMTKAQQLIVAQNNIKAFNDPSSVQYKSLQEGILKIFGLTNKATVNFQLSNNPGNKNKPLKNTNTSSTDSSSSGSSSSVVNSNNSSPSTTNQPKETHDTTTSTTPSVPSGNSSSTNTNPPLQRANCYQVTANFTALPGYELNGTTSFKSFTSIEGTTTLPNFETTVKGMKDTFNDDLNNFDGGAKALLQDLSNPSTSKIYNKIRQQIDAKLTNIPDDAYNFKVIMSDNPGEGANFSAKIEFTTTDGYGFDDKGTTKFTMDLGELSKIQGFVQTITPNDAIIKALNFAFPKIKDGNLLSSNLVGYALDAALGFVGKADFVTPPTWDTSSSPYKVSYTFKTSNPKKFMFNDPKTNKPVDTYTITLQTGVTSLANNHNNPWVNVNSAIESPDKPIVNKPVTLSVTANLKLPDQLKSLSQLLQLNFQWQSSTSNGNDAQWKDIEGANKAIYTFTPTSTSTTYYRCKVTLSPIVIDSIHLGESLYSNVVTVTPSN